MAKEDEIFNFDIQTGQYSLISPEEERGEDLEVALKTLYGFVGVFLAGVALVVMSVFSINERFK